MSKNITDSKIENKFVSTIKRMDSNQGQIRTVQQTDASAINIVPYPEFGYSSIIDIVPANTTVWYWFSIQPADFRLTNWNFHASLYVDSPSSTPEDPYQFPVGTALSAAQKNMRFGTWADWGLSGDGIGSRVHFVQIENRDSNFHNILVAVRFYGPEITIA